MWACTVAAIVDRAWSIGHADETYDVLAVAVISIFLNSLVTSFAVHMNLGPPLDEGDEALQHSCNEDEHTPFVYDIQVRRRILKEHGTGLKVLTCCLFVHNAAMFLANTTYVVAMMDLSEHNGVSRRLLVLLGFFVVWYRAKLANFWLTKHNFPQANVLLPQYNKAHVQDSLRSELHSYS